MVDDLRVRERGEVTYYQLKSGRVRKKGLYEDFRDQKALDESHDWICQYHLVVDTRRRALAAERWIRERELRVHCYAFSASLDFMVMAQLNPEIRDWMFTLTGTRTVQVWSTCYEILLARWLLDGDCNVRPFLRGLAVEKRHFHPRLFKHESSEAAVFTANLRDFGIDVSLENRMLRVLIADSEVAQVDYCTDEFFDRYNRWHGRCERLSVTQIIGKLVLEGLRC